MSRWLRASLIALVLFAGGCTMHEPAPPEPVPLPPPSARPVIDRILARGEVRIGTSGTQPPLTATTKDGTLIGFDIDLAAQLAHAMGVRLTLVPMAFAELLPSLQQGEIDMVLSGLTITPERNLKVAFVGPYLVSGMSILTREKTMTRLRRPDELDTPKVTLAALRGSTAETFANENVPRAKLVLVDTLDEGVEQVRKGKVDALLADHPFCLVAVYRYPSDHLQTLETPFTFEPLGIALPPSDPLLINWTQNTLADLDDSGAILDMMYSWFEEDAWVKQLR